MRSDKFDREILRYEMTILEYHHQIHFEFDFECARCQRWTREQSRVHLCVCAALIHQGNKPPLYLAATVIPILCLSVVFRNTCVIYIIIFLILCIHVNL